jgi:hypothetical protein
MNGSSPSAIKNPRPVHKTVPLLNRLSSYLVAIRKMSSLTDQVLVSGGNFLTIAICAHALPLAEQGKFTYIFASYIAVLLLNIAGQDGKKD